MGTGIYSDDYIHISNFSSKGPFFRFSEYTSTHLQLIPWVTFTRGAFSIFGWNLLPYEICKIIISFSSIFILRHFLKTYFSNKQSWVISFLIIFYPIHDSTVYWFNGQYFNFSCIWLILGFCLIERNRLYLGSFVNTLGAFWSYASPPFGAALSGIYLYRKDYKKAFIFFTPHLVYFIHYSLISFFDPKSTRFSDSAIMSKIKYVIIQFITFLDVQIGPSFFSKIFYSILENSLFSFFIGVIIFFVLYDKENKIKIKKEFLFFTLILCVASLLMFASTGRYFQMSFNLGNRVTFYSSFLTTVLFLWVGSRIKLYPLFLFILVISITGISHHWTEWSLKQQEVFSKIKESNTLKNSKSLDNLIVEGAQFSQMGPFSHIEFLAEDLGHFLVKSIYDQKFKNVHPLVNHLEVKEKSIRNKKYDSLFYFNKDIFVYNIKTDKIKPMKSEQFKDYIKKAKVHKRHWIQFLDDGFLKKLIIKLVPRVNYLF